MKNNEKKLDSNKTTINPILSHNINSNPSSNNHNLIHSSNSSLGDFDSSNNTFCVASLILNENINRTWKFMRDIIYLTKIATDICGPLTFHKGENTWTLGSEFSFLYINFFDLIVKCKKIHSTYSPRKIQIFWDCSTLGFRHIKTTSLYKVSDPINKTLVKINLNAIDVNEKKPPKIDGSYYKSVFVYILQSYDKYIRNSIEHLIEYQSFVVEKNYIDVWNYVINFENLGKISSFIGENFEIYDNHKKKGTFWKYVSFIDGKVNFFKVVGVKIYKKRNYREYIVETFGTQNSMINQEVKIKVTNIFGNKCQVSFTHFFKDRVTEKYLFYFNKIEQEFMEKLKETLQNI